MGRPAASAEVQPAGRRLVRAHAPDRSRPGAPAAPLWIERVELVEAARRAVDDQRVPVARGGAAALDLHVAGNGVRATIGFVGVLERDAAPGLTAPDDGDRDPDRSAIPEAGAEVCVEAGACSDRVDDLRGVRRDRTRVDSLVPGIRLREDRAARRAREAKRACGRASERKPNHEHEQKDAAHFSAIDCRSVSTKGSALPQRGGHSSSDTQRHG